MHINWNSVPITYYDIHSNMINEGDKVLMEGRVWDVMRTEDGYLGVDSTNPSWISTGRAAPGEYGVYPFCEEDAPELQN